jgi:hypothetical protein
MREGQTMRLPLDRFTNYRAIQARRAEQASCGHAVQVGDTIGYNPRLRPAKTVCADCWRRWVAENREADAYEAGLPW